MQTTAPSINRIKTADLLRTTGALTGNFGKAKVKAGSTLNDLGASTREHIGNLPTQDAYIRRLQEALGKTDDPRLVAFIKSELSKANNRKITDANRTSNPRGPYCDVRSRKHFACR